MVIQLLCKQVEEENISFIMYQTVKQTVEEERKKTISGKSGNLLGKKDVENRDLGSKAYAPTQNTKQAERRKNKRSGSLKNFSRKLQNLKKKRCKAFWIVASLSRLMLLTLTTECAYLEQNLLTP